MVVKDILINMRSKGDISLSDGEIDKIHHEQPDFECCCDCTAYICDAILQTNS